MDGWIKFLVIVALIAFVVHLMMPVLTFGMVVLLFLKVMFLIETGVL